MLLQFSGISATSHNFFSGSDRHVRTVKFTVHCIMMLFGNLCKVHAAAAAVVVCCIAYSYALKVMHHRCSLHYHHRLQVLNDHIHSDTVTCGYRTEGDIVIAGTASPIIAASSVRSLRNEAIRPVHTVVLASLSLLLSGVTVSSSQSSSATGCTIRFFFSR